MIVNENNSQPYMKSLTACLAKVMQDGFTQDFKVTTAGLQGLQNGKIYQPEEVEIVNFFRFEGTSNPDDEAVLYVLQTEDGVKGTLVDAYNIYADPAVSNFIKSIDRIHKKVTKN